jgi:transposase-like protein
MGRKRVLTEDGRCRAIDLYGTGMSVVEVAAALGVSSETARRALVMSGVEMAPMGRRPGVGEGEIAQMVKMYEAGATYAEVALEFGRDATTVCRLCREAGVVSRSKGTRSKLEPS